MTSRKWLSGGVVVLMLGAFAVPLVYALGRTPGAAVVYEGRLDPKGPNELAITLSIDPVLFRLTSVQGKYKVIRMVVDNLGKADVALAKNEDKFELYWDEKELKPVPGILNLSKQDPDLWASLPDALRKSLAYPSSVERLESVAVYVFLPMGAAEDLPRAAKYTLASFPQKAIMIRVPERRMAR